MISLRPIVSLRAYLLQYCIPDIEYISINICLNCQDETASDLYNSSDKVLDVVKLIGFTVHTTNRADCLLCNQV